MYTFGDSSEVIKQFQSGWKNTSETYPVIRTESVCFSISLVIQSYHTMLCWSNIVSEAPIHSFGFPCFSMVSGPTIWPFPPRLLWHSITKEVAQSQEVRAVTPERENGGWEVWTCLASPWVGPQKPTLPRCHAQAWRPLRVLEFWLKWDDLISPNGYHFVKGISLLVDLALPNHIKSIHLSTPRFFLQGFNMEASASGRNLSVSLCPPGSCSSAP